MGSWQWCWDVRFRARSSRSKLVVFWTGGRRRMHTGDMGWAGTRRLLPIVGLAMLAAVLVPGARAGSPERNPANANASGSAQPLVTVAETGALSKDAPAATSGASGDTRWDGEDPLTRDYPLFGVASY